MSGFPVPTGGSPGDGGDDLGPRVEVLEQDMSEIKTVLVQIRDHLGNIQANTARLDSMEQSLGSVKESVAEIKGEMKRVPSHLTVIGSAIGVATLVIAAMQFS